MVAISPCTALARGWVRVTAQPTLQRYFSAPLDNSPSEARGWGRRRDGSRLRCREGAGKALGASCQAGGCREA